MRRTSPPRRQNAVETEHTPGFEYCTSSDLLCFGQGFQYVKPIDQSRVKHDVLFPGRERCGNTPVTEGQRSCRPGIKLTN